MFLRVLELCEFLGVFDSRILLLAPQDKYLHALLLLPSPITTQPNGSFYEVFHWAWVLLMILCLFWQILCGEYWWYKFQFLWVFVYKMSWEIEIISPNTWELSETHYIPCEVGLYFLMSIWCIYVWWR